MHDAQAVADASPRPAAAVATADAALSPYVARMALRWLGGTPDERVRVLSGTLAFVDISGFTRLTEILAARGKAGAEEVTGYLDALFAELLAIAYEGGGELIKWGGDAVLVWFSGDDHAARAVDSAWRMQRAIARSGRLKTSAGPATLRMSVGVHSGDFHFFTAGSRHRELVITGPAASITAHMEAVAEAGEIVVSAATAALLDGACIGDAKQDGHLVAAPPRLARVPQGHVAATAVPRGAERRSPNRARPDLCLPTALGDHLQAAPVESEHRQAAVAFVEFGGVDRRLEQGEAEQVAADLDALTAAVQDTCVRNRVTFWETDIAEDGGKVMLVAGAPSTGGDDAGHMLVAVREILDTPSRLRLRAGVNHGRVFTGGFGPAYRRTFSAKGDAVNLAARLMARAGAGELYAADAVLQRSRVPVSADALEPFHVKGKAQPVHAQRVTAMRAAHAEEQAPQGNPLVGRERELDLLAAQLDAAMAGNGRCVELIGPAGIGKSRLTQELQARAGGARVVAVACQEYQRLVPYASMRVLVRRCLDLDLDAGPTPTGVALSATVRRIAPQLAPWLPLIAGVVGADVEPTEESSALDERFRRQRLEEALLDLLTAALPAPALLSVEDAEWIDDAGAAFLRTLAAALPSRPWLLLVARRPEQSGLLDGVDGVVAMELQPLDREAVARVLRVAAGGQPLSPHQRDALADRSGGNPLFLLELLGSGLHSGFAGALPDTVEGVFAAQIDRLAPAQRRLLRIASVLGVQVSVPVLEAMAGEDPAPLVGDFLTRDGADTLRFRHGMLRDAAYEGLPYARRRELHGVAARVLEQRAGSRPAEIAGLLAVHFGHAGERAPEWRYARLAGERARGVNAPVEAATFFEQALHAGQGLPGVTPDDMLAVAEALGDARSRLGQFAAAGATYRAARRHAAAALDRARLDYKAALATDRAADYPKTLRTLTRAEHGIDGADGRAALRLRAEIRAQYGLVRHRQGRGHDAVRLLQQAVSLADEAQAADVLANALLYLDIAEIATGFGGDGGHARRALDIARRTGDQPWLEAPALNQLGIRAYYGGRWSECVDLYAESRAACERAGDRWTAAVESANIAEVLADQGRLAEAEPVLEEALETYRAAGTSAFVADGTRILGRLASRRGDAARAAELLVAARAIYAADGESLQVALTDAMVAESLLRAGDSRTAAELAERVLSAAAAMPWRHMVAPLALRVLAVSLYDAGGDDVRALQLLRDSVEVARGHDAAYELALSMQALGDLWPNAMTSAELAERDALFRELGVVDEARRMLAAGLPEARV